MPDRRSPPPHAESAAPDRDLAARARALARSLAPLDLAGRLEALRGAIAGRLVLTTSFGLEDQVLTHVVATRRLDIAVVTLDTGRLFPETHEVWARTEARYGMRIPALHPDRDAVEALVAAQGPVGFRDSVAAREACCRVRKVVPLGRALEGAAGWITGLRAGQSVGRGATPLVEHDAARGLLKASPLADVSRERLAAFVRDADIPYNSLHDRGFPSIGCAPCTRAVRLGEDERAGRWWWEADAAKECGLHRPRPAAALPGAAS